MQKYNFLESKHCEIIIIIIIIIIIKGLLSLSFHSNSEIREKDSYGTRQITSLLLRSLSAAGYFHITDATSLVVRIVSEFPPLIRTMTGSPG
jgi:hypothetical protein